MQRLGTVLVLALCTVCYGDDPVLDAMLAGVKIPQDELTSMEKTIAVRAHEQVQKVFGVLTVGGVVPAGGSSADVPRPGQEWLSGCPQDSAQAQGDLAARLGLVGCPTCPYGKSYAECPESWVATAEGVCQAPATYLGFCMQALDFSLYAEAEKDELEASCKFCWYVAAVMRFGLGWESQRLGLAPFRLV